MQDEVFLAELEVYRADVESGFLYFHANVAANDLALEDSEFLTKLNQSALYWNIVQSSLQISSFLALGRIFDQTSGHGVDAVIRCCQKNSQIFSIDSLMARKMAALGGQESLVKEYVRDVYVASARDFRRLRRYIRKYRSIYERRFHPIRNGVYAHTEITGRTEINEAFSLANVTVLNRMYLFLYEVHRALWNLFHNGRRPRFWVPRHGKSAHQMVGRVDASMRRLLLAPKEMER